MTSQHERSNKQYLVQTDASKIKWDHLTPEPLGYWDWHVWTLCTLGVRSVQCQYILYMPGELHIQQGDLQLKDLLLASTCHSTILAERETQTRFVRSWTEKVVCSVLFPSIMIRTDSNRCEVTREGVAQLDMSHGRVWLTWLSWTALSGN